MASDPLSRIRRASDDRGVVVVLLAALLASLLVVAAFVIDLGGARSAKAKDQISADAIALAGAARLDPSGGDNQAACTAAWNYLATNSGVTGSAPSCLPFAGTCVAATTRQVSTTQGDYQITFTNPVPDSDAFFTGQPAQASDSTPCQRFGVRITHTWRYLLQSGSAPIQTSAVAKFEHAPGTIDAPLIITSAHGCETLVLNGNSHVTMLTATGDPGYIAIDSDGSQCTSGNKVVLDATGTSQIVADAISMWALTTGNTAKAYDPADVGDGRALSSAPIAQSAPVGRSSIDNIYNCSVANGCTNATPPYIDNLVAADGGTGVPTGYTRWSSVYSCSPGSDIAVPSGNWYIDCGSGGVSTSANLTFQGGNIVADGPFNLTGSGSLRTNCNVASPATACPSNPSSSTTMYIRNGGLNKSGSANLSLNETFVYLANGGVDMTGNGSLTWTAPDDSTYPFDDLLVWVNSNASVRMTGDTNTDVEGIFFAPNSAATLSGSSVGSAINAQMFVSTATLSGDLTLAPRADRALQLGGASSGLIR